MLPSSGLFSNFACPLYINNECKRAHCHYKHNINKQEQVQVQSSVNTTTTTATTLTTTTTNNDINKRTYNPTPIAELKKTLIEKNDINKRHIPVPYTPLRPEPRHLNAAVSRYRPSLPPLTAPVSYNPVSPASSYNPTPPAYSPSPSLSTTRAPDEVSTYLPNSVPGYNPNLAYSPINSKALPGKFEYKPTPLEETAQFSTDSDCDEPVEKKAKPDDTVAKEKYDPPKISNVSSVKSDPVKKKTEDDLKSGSDKKHRSRESTSRSGDDKAESHSSRSKSVDEKSTSGDKKHGKSRNEKNDSKHKSRSSTSSKSSRSQQRDNKSDKEKNPPYEKDKKSREIDHRSKFSKTSSRSSLSRDSKTKNINRKNENKPSMSREADVVLIDDNSFDEDLIDYSDSDEEDVTQECLKIFEEYVPIPKTKIVEPSKETENGKTGNEDVFQFGKKRVAHLTDRVVKRPVSKPTIDHKALAVQLMSERTSKIKEFHKMNSIPNLVKPASTVNSGLLNVGKPSKIRIAHVPNVSTMLDSKKTIVKNTPETKPVTIAQTISKGVSRVAHVPNENFTDRPGVLEPTTSKISSNVRTSFLHRMIEECLKIYVTTEDAYERALQEELSTSKKCKTTAIYKNSAMNAISRLRKEIVEAEGIKKNLRELSSNVISHKNILIGKLGNRTSWSIENKYKKDIDNSPELKGHLFYENISKWLLTEEELRENGFPRPHPSYGKGRAIIYRQNEKQKPAEGNVRWCCRCKKDYKVDKNGFPILKQECIYHPNNKYRFRGEVKYQCCKQDSFSDGCLSASTHVYEFVDYENLSGYVKTFPNDKKDHGVYALDCEMCYTTHGLDLTRVTIIDSNCKVIYDTLVKPLHPIIDYNTRYSGLTEEQMADVTTSLLDVQATMMSLFSDKTILVGHSLESDFKALKLIHDTIVDTSVLFPHKMGLPFKRALRNLSSEKLNKIIQNSVDGHDSTEDATVCMELIRWKLKEELKLR